MGPLLRLRSRHIAVVCAFVAFLLSGNPRAYAQREKVLYSFGANGIGDGNYPQSGLTSDHNGNLYGTTYYGGAYNAGTVFELSPPAISGGAWTETILHSFQGYATDGTAPAAELVLDKFGNLYGTTLGGGTTGLGIVYELVRPSQVGEPWTESVIYNFADAKHGTTGENGAGIVFVKGSLFVVTIHGGSGNGNVFELKPPLNPGGSWRGGQIFAFPGGAGGFMPLSGGGALISDGAGNLYGTALTGTGSDSLIFELSPPPNGSGSWTETVLYSTFNDDLAMGGSLTFDDAGNLYGTAAPPSGVGTSEIFELSPPFYSGQSWGKSVLYSFNSANPVDGYNPYGGLLFDSAGNLYGTTAQGGTGKCNCGTVFELSPGYPWTKTILRSFSGQPKDGSYPHWGLIMDSAQHLYGTTPYGGVYGNGPFIGGTVFEVVP